MLLPALGCEAQVRQVTLEFDRNGPAWEGLGLQIYPWLKEGVYFGDEEPAAVYARLREELGIRYARVMVRIDNQQREGDAWHWDSPPGYYNENLWESMAAMQQAGVEPIVTPLFWPEGLVADQTYPDRDNSFIGSEESYANVVQWFEELCRNAPEHGFEPRLASIQNEPDNTSHLKFETTQLRRATQEVADRLEELDCPIQLLIGDTATMYQAGQYIPSQIHGVPKERIRSLAYHSYGTDRRDSMYMRLRHFDQPIWMTEQAYNEVEHPRESWEFAEEVGQDFYRDVAVARAGGWFLWSLGPGGEDILHDGGWTPHAEVQGLIGRHVPPGAVLRVAQDSGRMNFLGWESDEAFYLWVLNRDPTDQDLNLAPLDLTRAQAWEVTRETPTSVPVEGSLDNIAGDSARLYLLPKPNSSMEVK